MKKSAQLEKIEYLKKRVFEMSNTHCFIEKERFIRDLPPREGMSETYFAELFAGLVDSASTPVDENDIFVGRMVEAEPDADMKCPSRTFFAKGHITPNYERLLKKGYRGILEEIKKNAEKINEPYAYTYAKNAETVIEAIKRFAKRYAEAAREAGNERAYEALLRVPYEPAYDLYSALQGIWLAHMIASCYVGSRDYAFGYMDEYLYPYYKSERERGVTDGEISEMLAGFFVKANEICGRAAHNYNQKPVLSNSSKQYVLLDGGRANELSTVILKAARINKMAQPEFTVILTESSKDSFKNAVFETMSEITDKIQVYNGRVMSEFLRSEGLPEEIVTHPAVSACCTFDIYLHSCREEFYLPTPQIFCDTVHNGEFSTKAELLEAFKEGVKKECQGYLDETRSPDHDWTRMVHVLDTLLLSNCNEKCKYPPYGVKYRAKNIFLPAVATLGDSLCALDKLVFSGEIPYRRFADALKADFVGYEDIYEKIAALDKFGNDNEDADAYTAEIGNLMIDAVKSCRHDENEIVAPSFYSLERNNVWAKEIPATPNGRRAGSPVSENQSPTYGADKNGITALLSSIARLPFERTAAGGLNLTFSSAQRPEILKALIETYFKKGGLHAGVTVLNREQLIDAMENPEKYPALTVRLYGFSEYFICMPKWQQEAVLERTAY